MKSFAVLLLLAAASAATAATTRRESPNPPAFPGSSGLLRTSMPLSARDTVADACTDDNEACAVGGSRWVCGGGHWIYAETCNTEECCDPLPDRFGMYCSCGARQ
jgi:hypothetical protein